MREIEDSAILKRWKSPSIIEALNYPHILRMLVFCTAVLFKYRCVNKRMQLYEIQIQGLGDYLNGGFLISSELIQIFIGAWIFKKFNGRRIKLNFFLVVICIPIEIA